MPEIGVPELLIVAFIVVLLFGPSKAADLGGSLGKSIREFRRASREGAEPDPALGHGSPNSTSSPNAIGGAADAMTAAPVRFCTECGARLHDGQRFCTSCGATAIANVSS
jgi:sec-independent protein translocase protein TatA